jgi:beta-lactamase superfamily II metal-dependent hydrolase
MADIFRIDMLPAREGDCLWIEYGDEVHPHRIVIDGGRGRLAFDTMQERFESLPEDQREIELAILTHVDADHIEGILRLVNAENPIFTIKDLWFNAFHHLDKESSDRLNDDSDVEELGAVQGEELTSGLVRNRLPWNLKFEKGSVVVPDSGVLPVCTLSGGMKLTLLSPTWPKLEKLLPVWEREVRRAGLVPGAALEEADEDEDEDEEFGPLTINDVEELADSRFFGDRSEANGTSIVVVAEFGGKRALLTGDAHMDVLEPAIDKYAAGDDSRREFDAFKISHHGSKGTLSREVLEKITCPRYLVSTNGTRHKHPNREAIARILKFGGDEKSLFFNYASEFTKIWDARGLKEAFTYKTEFPIDQNDGLLGVELL